MTAFALRGPADIDRTIANILTVLGLVIGTAGILYFLTSDLAYRDTTWGKAVCSTSQRFCENPSYLLLTATVLLVIAIALKFRRLPND